MPAPPLSLQPGHHRSNAPRAPSENDALPPPLSSERASRPPTPTVAGHPGAVGRGHRNGKVASPVW